MGHHSQSENQHSSDKDKKYCEDFRKKYKKAFGYGDYESEGGTHLIDGANFDGDYKVYFDCYKKRNKTKLRMWADKNGDGEYSGKGELIAYSGKLNKECAKYCEDFKYGKLTVDYDVVKDYAKGKQEKKEFKRAYESGDECYGYKNAKKKVKKYDEYGDAYYEKKTYKKWYKCEIEYVKLDLKAFYDKKVCEKYDDGYGGYEKRCDYEKKACETSFKISKYDYLNNYETAIDFCA